MDTERFLLERHSTQTRMVQKRLQVQEEWASTQSALLFGFLPKPLAKFLWNHGLQGMTMHWLREALTALPKRLLSHLTRH